MEPTAAIESATGVAGLNSGSYLPIRTVSEITGVNAITLRAWERRYGLIKPGRTSTGHRLYSQKDLQQIHHIVDLLQQGISISRVKPILDSDNPQSRNTYASDPTWKKYRQDMIRAIENFDEISLDNFYSHALADYPVDIVNQRLIEPLLRTIGERWKNRENGIAEEHFFSVYLRNKLGERIHHSKPETTGPTLLLACLPGEQHDIGLLLFALAAINRGYRVLILGANTPLEQIPGVLSRRECHGVVLSGANRIYNNQLDDKLKSMVTDCPIPVFVGGRAPTAKTISIVEEAGGTYLGESISAAARVLSDKLAVAP